MSYPLYVFIITTAQVIDVDDFSRDGAMFNFCRGVKKWIVAVIIWSHLQLSMAYAAHQTLWFDIDRDEDSQELMLKISHAAPPMGADEAPKVLLANPTLTFENRALHTTTLKHGQDCFAFQGQATSEACTLSLSQGDDRLINLVVYQGGRVVVSALKGWQDDYHINTCGVLTTKLHPLVSTGVHTLTLTGQNIINQQDLEVAHLLKITATGTGEGQGQIVNRGSLQVGSFTSQSINFINCRDIDIKDEGIINTAAFDNHNSTLQADRKLKIKTQTLNNDGGQIWGGVQSKIEATGDFTNQKGTIGSQQVMAVVLHTPTQALGTLVAPQLMLSNPITALMARQGSLLATSWLHISAIQALLPNVDLQMPLCRLRVGDVQLSPQEHCAKTVVERDHGQSFELTYPYVTKGSMEIRATHTADSKVSAVVQQPAQLQPTAPKPELSLPQTLKIMANLQADGGLTVQGSQAQLMIGSEAAGISSEILLEKGALIADVGQFVLDKGVVAALSARIKAPQGIHIGRLVRDATRDCFATVYCHSQCRGSHSLGSHIYSAHYKYGDQTIDNVYDGRHLMCLPVMVGNKTALMVKTLADLEGALKLQGVLETQDCMLTSDQDHKCLAAEFKVKHDLQFKGKGHLHLKRVHGLLHFSHITSVQTYVTNYPQTISDPSVMQVDRQIRSDQPITLFNHSSHLHFKAKDPQITINSQDFTAHLYQQFITGTVVERQSYRDAKNPAYYLTQLYDLPPGRANLLPDYQPCNAIYASGCLPWAVGFLQKTNGFAGAQQHFPANTSSATATILPADGNRLGGNITMPQMLVFVGAEGVMLGSPQTYPMPPQAPVRPLTPRQVNLLTTVVLDNLTPFLRPVLPSQAFQFVFRERFWFDPNGAQKFYHDLQNQIMVLSPQGTFEAAPQQALFSLSPHYLVDRIQQECQQVLKRGTIDEDRAIDAAYVQELHRHMSHFIHTHHLDGASMVQALTQPGATLPVPTQAMVYYESLRNDHGADELCPRLCLPPAMIQRANAAVGSQITTNTLLILPQGVTPSQLLDLLRNQPVLQQTMHNLLLQYPDQSRYLEDQAALGQQSNNTALAPHIHTGSVTLNGNIYADYLAAMVGGSIVSHANIETVDAILVSLFDNVMLESKVERVGTGQVGDFVEQIKQQARIEAKNILRIFASQNVIFKGACTDSGLATHIQALANIYKVPVELMSQRIEYFYGRTKGTQITRTSTPVVSEHTSRGVFKARASRSIHIYGSHIKANKGRIEAADGVTIDDVHALTSQEIHLRKKSRNFVGISTSKEFHEYTASSTSQGPLLDFKKGGIIRSDTGDVSMTHPHLRGGITVQAHQGAVFVHAGVNQQMSSFTWQSSNLVWQANKQNQQNHVTYVQPYIEDTLTIEALETHIQQVAGQRHPFLEKVRVAEGDLLTRTLYEIHYNKTRKRQGLTPAAGAVVSLAASFATAGMGSYVAGAMASFMPAVATSVGVAAQSMAAGALVSAVNNLGDPGAVLRDVTSSRALRSYVKAGIQDGLIAPLPTRQAFSLPTYAIHAVVKNAVSATLSTVIEGKKIHQALDEAWCNTIADTVAPYAASHIGLAYGQGWIDGLSHKLAHGVVGGTTGAILKGEAGIVPGAFGAMMVETLGELFVIQAADLDQEIMEEAADCGVLLHPDSPEYQALRQDKITAYGNWAKMGTAISAVLLDQDVDVAIKTASYAADHNLIPLLIGLATVGGVLWTTYDVVDTYLKEGEIAALEKLAIEGALNLIPFGLGKLHKAGKLSIKALPKETIHKIWQQYCRDNPLVTKLISKLSTKPLDHQVVKQIEQQIHRNSHTHVGETHVYRIIDQNGKTYKIGESAQGVRKRDGASIRAEAQARKLRKETGQDFETEIREVFDTKKKAHAHEHELIKRFRRLYGKDALPGNKSNH